MTCGTGSQSRERKCIESCSQNDTDSKECTRAACPGRRFKIFSVFICTLSNLPNDAKYGLQLSNVFIFRVHISHVRANVFIFRVLLANVKNLNKNFDGFLCPHCVVILWEFCC